MNAYKTTSPRSNMSCRQGNKAASRTYDLNLLFNQAKASQDLLRFEHDPYDIDPAVSVIQEYARAVRLLYIRTRWSKLGLSDWHSEMRILISARSSMLMGLDVWDPLDDFFDTYVFEMEIQPQSELDARGRKVVKRGLLRQLQDIASKELEGCHKALCDLLEESLSNWRSLDSRLLTFKKKVWKDCEQRGSLCLLPQDEVAPSPLTVDLMTPQTSPIFPTPPMTYNFTTPTTPQTFAPSVPTQGNYCYSTPTVNYTPILHTYIY
jgi:hypothetical protein